MQVTLVHATQNPEIVAGMAAWLCRHPKEAATLAEKFAVEAPDADSAAELKTALRCAIRCGHLSVVEHVSYTFLIDGISRACSHQLVRHRMASFTQASQRHAKAGEGIMPKGMCGVHVEEWMKAMRNAYASYEKLIELGLPMEDARSVLPNASSTTLIMTMNARELAHFLELRLCNKAQREIRELAKVLLQQAKAHFPLMFEYVGPPCLSGQCREAKPCGWAMEEEGGHSETDN